MTNPVKELLENIELSMENNDYSSIKITTNNLSIYTTVFDLIYVNRYFFKIKTDGGEVIVNINNLECVELS